MAYLSRTLEKVIKLNSSPIKRSWWAASYLTRWINGACYWHFYYCHFFYFSVKNDSYSKLCLLYFCLSLSVSMYFHDHLFSPFRHLLCEVCGWVRGGLWSLLPRLLLPFMGSDFCWPPLSPWVVLSSRISVWTSARWSTHHCGSTQA